MGLKGSKTEQNLKDAFAGESQANRRYLYFGTRLTLKARTMLRRCSVPPPKVKRATHTAIWNSWKPRATRRPGCRSARAGRT